jgi:hypothetical protein
MSSENRYQKGNDHYTTPDWIKKGMFAGWWDPCPLNKEYQAYDWKTGEYKDGLLVEWKANKIYINPPYSKPLPWIERAILESKKGKTIALLVKHDSSTKWWAMLHEAGAHFLPIMGRLSFNGGDAAPFPSVLVILASNANQEKSIH